MIQKLTRAPWWLLVMALGIIVFIVWASRDTTYVSVWDAVREGIWTTIWISVTAYALALVLGLLIALLRRSSNIFIYQAVTFYVELVRGIPTLVLVYYLALALIPQIILNIQDLGSSFEHLVVTFNVTGGWSFDLDLGRVGSRMANFETRDFPNANRAIIALAVSYSAFLSEVFRAGLDSISIGQREAARSLGMTRWQVMRFIVLPQAIRVILPPLGNDFIAMLKESSLVSVLGVTDITRRGITRATGQFVFFPVYNIMAITYLVMTLSLSMAVKLLEMYLDRGQDR
ncbi:MAG: amino acid ABC transporter permease [Chloroflexi bacterium]|nr:amino acid ABC transporter permease [Chloroflexota bacterium]